MEKHAPSLKTFLPRAFPTDDLAKIPYSLGMSQTPTEVTGTPLTSETPSKFGRFSGEPHIALLVEEGEDYKVYLLKDFSYTDPFGNTVHVPTGTLSDGASIPPWAWVLFGAPLSGNFRRAAIIHDFECQNPTVDWGVIHRRFYYAMRCDNVGRFRATCMYLAVRYFGPPYGA